MVSIINLLLIVVTVWTVPKMAWHYALPKHTHPKLVPHLDAMKQDAAKYGIRIDYTQLRYVGVKNLGWIGASGLGKYPHVLIDDDTLDRSILRELVYHEVAHSLLGCDHSSKDVDSLMHPTWIAHEMSWDELVEQFFTVEYKYLCNK